MSKVQSMIDRLHRGEQIHVKVPGGAQFSISHKEFAGAHGYKANFKGKKPKGVQGGHVIMDKDDLHNWLSSLEEDSSQHEEAEQFSELKNIANEAFKLGKKRNLSARARELHEEAYKATYRAVGEGSKFAHSRALDAHHDAAKLIRHEGDSALADLHQKAVERHRLAGKVSQHSEQSLPEYVPRESTHVSGPDGSFGPAILVKQKKEAPATQYAEGERIAGRSSFLAAHRRSGPHSLLNRLVKKYGGIVHNPSGGFTLPKKSAEAFNQAARDAGFQHGYHYSLNG